MFLRRSRHLQLFVALMVIALAGFMLWADQQTLSQGFNRSGNNSNSIPQQIGNRTASDTIPVSKHDQTTQAQLIEGYGRLPLSFEANRGQVDSQVKFLSRGVGYNLFLTPSKTVLELKPKEAEARGAVLQMHFVGANTEPRLTGLDELPGKSNYFIGNDPQKWQTDVPNYAMVQYEEVYPGVDLIYYGNQRQLEYDLVVHPGANPEVIGLSFEGVDKIEVDTNGDLLLKAAGGELRQRKPVVYQEADGGRQIIASNYLLKGNREVGFQLAAYDAGRPLVIDPVLIYSTYFGGNASDSSNGIAVDSTGSAYVTGDTSSTNFPITSGGLQTTSGGASDVFIGKLNPAGSALVYSTYLGGSAGEGGNRIAVDSAGNAYVIGNTSSTNFPTTSGAYQTTLNGPGDVFVTKLNPTGNGLVYSTYLGGSAGDGGSGIAIDSAGNAYLTGNAPSTDFPTTAGAFQPTFGGGPGDAFVTKLNTTGTALVYSTYLGGSGNDGASNIAVDSAGNAYVTGGIDSTNFPTTAGAFDTTSNGGNDAYVTKVNTTGSALVYSTYLGGGSRDIGSGIAVDSAGNAYVTGPVDSSNFPTTAGAFQTTFNSAHDVYVTKLNPTGSALLYSTFITGNSSEDVGNNIAVDSSGNAYITGFTQATNFPTVSPLQASLNGSRDAFVAKLNTNASGAASLVYSTYLGGGGQDNGNTIAIDSAGNAYIVGSTRSTNFPTANPLQPISGGGADLQDGFIAKIADNAESLSINDVAVTEGNSGTINAVFTVTLSPASAQTVTVNFATADGTATAGSDYTATSGTLTFSPGETSKTITVAVNGDTFNEATETFFVNLTSPTNASISDGQGVGTINDNDPLPSLSINDTNVNEGNTGTNVAIFTVTLSAASGQTVTVNFTTADGTATAGSDYVANSGTLTFSPGTTTQNVNVMVNGDSVNEADETFFVNLTSPTNATISDGQGMGTIFNDDLTLSPSTLPDGTVGVAYSQTITASGGTAPFTFTVISGALPTVLMLSSGGVLSGTPTVEGSFTFTVRATDANNFTGSRSYTLTINCASITLSPMSAGSSQDPPTSFLDDFSGSTLGPDYSIRPGIGDFSLSENPGFLRYKLAGSTSPNYDNTALWVYRQFSGNDWTFETKVTYSLPFGNGRQLIIRLAFGGLEQRGVNEVQFIRTRDIGDTGELDASFTEGGVGNGVVLQKPPNAADTYVVRIIRRIQDVSIQLSPDGTSFTTVGQRTYSTPLGNLQTVLFSGANFAGTGFADYDYVSVNGSSQVGAALSTGTVGTAYSQTITASGGTGPYAFTVASGALPTGLMLSSSGLLSGIPTVAGAFTFTVTATDSNGCAGSRSYTISIVSPNQCTTTSFSGPTNFGVGSNPRLSVVADFNGDNKLDLAVANVNSHNISILLGTGTGSFSNATNFPVGAFPFSVAAGDFNEDGKLDLAATSNGANSVSILLGTGTGSFGEATNFPAGTGPIEVVVGDYNRDGNLDLAVTSGNPINVSILLGNGAGSFGAATNFPIGSGSSSVIAGDFNGDGKLDLAATTGGANSVSILLGTGTGSFGVATNFPVGTNAAVVAAGDFNGDGRLDLAVTNNDSSNVSILIGTGTGSFDAATNFPVGVKPNFVAVGDFNGDAKLDLAVTSTGPNNVSVLLGDGTGSFGTGMNFTAGTTPFGVAAGDFNGDGRPDLAVTNNGSNNVSILLNDCSPPIMLSPATLPNGTVGTPYSQTITASGGTAPYTFTVTGGTLPTGLMLSPDGVLSGTPIAAGSFTFTVTATDANNFTGSRTYTVMMICPTITLSPSTLPGGTVDIPYSETITASGGTTPYIFTSTGTLPSGLTLSSGGVLSGTPTEIGSFTFTVIATDANGCTGSQGYTVAVGSAGRLQFSDPTYSINESGPTATITVTRTIGTNGTVSVKFTAGNGTATVGSDYAMTTGTLTFDSGETSKSFTVPILDDNIVEGDETVNLTLSDPTGGATLGSQKTAVLTIIDNDTSLQFESLTFSVNEGTAKAFIKIVRKGITSTTVQVGCATSNTGGSAKAGEDYDANGEIITFVPGDTEEIFTIPVGINHDDSLAEGDETVILLLSTPTGGATLGTPNMAVLTIVDNDVALQFRSPTFVVNENENEGKATITVIRTGGMNEAVSVIVTASNGSATSGSDYISPGPVTLNFGPGESSKSFDISIINDSSPENNESVNLTLSNQTGGVQLGPISTAVLTIIDDDNTAKVILARLYPLAVEPGSTLKITGSGFDDKTILTIGDAVIPSANVALDSPTQISVLVPPPSTNLNGPATVTAGGETATSANLPLSSFTEPPGTRTSPTFVLLGDVTQDGAVNMIDLARLRAHFDPNGVPLPASNIRQFIAADVSGSDPNSGRNPDGSFGNQIIEPKDSTKLAKFLTGFIPNFSITSPRVIAFSPLLGVAGNTVTITGTDFTNESIVKFNGVNAQVDSITPIQITARVPAEATTGAISVTTAAGTGISQSLFTVTTTVLSVTGFTPVGGAPGTEVIITGTGLENVTSVQFNGVNAEIKSGSISQILITAIVPEGARTGTIKVMTANGSATSVGKFVLPPRVTGFSPESLRSGPEGSEVTLTGENLAVESVSFNGIRVNISGLNPDLTQLKVLVPGGATTGPISVINSAGRANFGTGALVPGFTVTTPKINRFSPRSGPVGTTVKITGVNLGRTISVQFNGVNAEIKSLTPTLEVLVPQGALTGPIRVVTLDGPAQSLGNFTVAGSNAPVVEEISRKFGPAGTTTLTITGMNLTGTTSVKFNGVVAPNFIASDKSITVTVPANADPGKNSISVTAAGGTATSPDDFVVVPTTSNQIENVKDVDVRNSGETGFLTINIVGKNFTTQSMVFINDVEFPIESFSIENGDEVLTVKFPMPTGTADTDLDVEVRGPATISDPENSSIKPLAAPLGRSRRFRVTISVQR
jgi:hypothetical protein